MKAHTRPLGKGFFALLSCFLAALIVGMSLPVATMPAFAVSSYDETISVKTIENNYTENNNQTQAQYVWEQLKTKIEGTTAGTSLLVNLDGSILKASSTIKIPEDVTVGLECANSAHTYANTDIIRHKDHHDNLFVVSYGATLNVNCCISGGSDQVNGALLYDGNGKQITDNTLSSLGSALRGDGYRYAPVNTVYYGKALIFCHEDSEVNVSGDMAVLKYNYNPYSRDNENEYTDGMYRVADRELVSEYSETVDGAAVKIKYYNLPCKTSDDGIVSGTSGSAIAVGKGIAKLSDGARVYGCSSDEGPAVNGIVHVFEKDPAITLLDSVLFMNVARDSGGAVFAASRVEADSTSPAQLLVSGTDIHNNRAKNAGGGIATMYSAILKVEGCDVHHNAAQAGGGMFVNGGADKEVSNVGPEGGIATVTAGAVYSNTATGYGGGIATGASASASIENSLNISNVAIHNNKVTSGSGNANPRGGGVYVASYSTLTTNNVNIYENECPKGGAGVYITATGDACAMTGGYVKKNISTVDGSGGGIATQRTEGLTLTEVEVSENVAPVDAGGVYNGGTLVLNKTAISQNTATGYGGGISNTGTLSFNSGEVIGNTANTHGGGVYSTGTLNQTGGRIVSNTATTNGGGVYNAGTFVMTSGEIAGNKSGGSGGGVYNNSNGTLNLKAGRIEDNEATKHGGGIYFTTAGGASTIGDNDSDETVISGNTAGENGGGIASVRTNGITLDGPLSISNNSAKYGGGVYAKDLVDYKGSEIISNTATVNGQGVFVVDGATFKMSGAASIDDDNDVYLGGYAFITVPSSFHIFDYVRAVVNGDNFEPGRIIAKYGDDAEDKGSEGLYWDASTPSMDEQNFKVGRYVLRSGDQGAAKNNEDINSQDIFLSQEYSVTFDIDSLFSFEQDDIKHVVGDNEYVAEEFGWSYLHLNKYWYEALSFNTGHGVNADGTKFLSWNTDPTGEGTEYSADQDVVIEPSFNKELVLYGQWDAQIMIDVDYDGNGATEGENWTDSGENGEGVPLDEDYTLSDNKEAFERTEQFASVYSLRARTATAGNTASLYSFEGWSFDKDAPKSEYNFGETVTSESGILNQNIKNNEERERAVATVYAVWDQFPTIEAEDRWFTLDEVKTGKVTLEELMSTAVATDGLNEGLVTDFSDNEISGKEEFTIIDFDVEEFKALAETDEVRSATVTYKAVDQAGNETYKTVTIHIVDKTRQNGEVNMEFVRFVSPKFFVSGEGLVSEENGGLSNNSKWVTDAIYKTVLENVLANTKNAETGKWGTVYKSFSFTGDDLANAKTYILENLYKQTPTGDYKMDSSRLVGFYSEFLNKTE